MPFILEWIQMSVQSFAKMHFKLTQTMNRDGVN